jgi:hypothetical protein
VGRGVGTLFRFGSYRPWVCRPAGQALAPEAAPVTAAASPEPAARRAGRVPV